MAYEIDIDIKPDGTFSFGVKGVKGKKCQEITKFLEELGQTLSTEATSEMYQVEEQAAAEEHVHVESKK
jgi:hypothetical protein